LYAVSVVFSVMSAPPSRSGLASRKFDGRPALIARLREARSASSASAAAYGFGLNRASGLTNVALRKLAEV
jgi:hypothetical protein